MAKKTTATEILNPINLMMDMILHQRNAGILAYKASNNAGHMFMGAYTEAMRQSFETGLPIEPLKINPDLALLPTEMQEELAMGEAKLKQRAENSTKKSKPATKLEPQSADKEEDIKPMSTGPRYTKRT